MKTEKEKIIKNLIVKWELDKEMRIDELLNLCYKAGKAEAIKQLRGKMHEHHAIELAIATNAIRKNTIKQVLEIIDKWTFICGSAFVKSNIEELKSKLGELAK